MLCKVCQQMFDHPVFLATGPREFGKPIAEQDWDIPFPLPGRENQPMLHHRSIRALQESGEICALCSLIDLARREQCIDADQDLNQKPFGSCWFVSISGFKSDLRGSHLEIHFSSDGQAYSRYNKLDFFLEISKVAAIHGNASLSPELWEQFLKMEDASTQSERTFATLKWWLSDCRHSHTSCRSTASQPWFPTRLIDVDSEPKLIISGPNYPPFSQQYITLSHCWGTIPVIKLTTSTISAFLIAIPMSTLPKTFQDAIVVTRGLGLRYLWIDSLCIIQDSENDWRFESSVMGRVYRRSALTISALDSENSHGGLFRQRDMTRMQPCCASLRLNASGERDDIYVHSEIGLGIDEIDKGPLNRRAWVLQERLLSPRVVYFGRNQIFWECNELNAGETFPHGTGAWVQNLLNPKWISIKKQLRPLEIDGNSQSVRFRKYRDWEAVMRTYTAANLTHRTDRLIAISAIAKEYAVSLRDEYVAGLWRGDLLGQLCWFQSGPELHSTRSTDNTLLYQAPSWSWASLNRPVSNNIIRSRTVTEEKIRGNIGTRKANIEIVDVCITPVGKDATGQISRGIITIRGPVVRGTFSPERAPLRHDAHIEIFSSVSKPHLSHQVQGGVYWDKEPKYETELTFLQIFFFKINIYTLVLEADGDENYTRVGLLRYRRPGFGELWAYDMFEDADIETLTIE